jgi:hypothetical protein
LRHSADHIIKRVEAPYHNLIIATVEQMKAPQALVVPASQS